MKTENLSRLYSLLFAVTGAILPAFCVPLAFIYRLDGSEYSNTHFHS